MEQARLSSQKRTQSLRWGLGLAVALLVLGWLFNTPPGILGKADAVGYAVCHRIDLRSFQLGDRQLPLCARCTGMYLGAAVGLVYQAIFGGRRIGFPPRSVVIFLLLFVGAFSLDGVNSFLALLIGRGLLYPPDNIFRVFSGTGMGLVIVSALFPAFNQTMWRNWQDAPVFSGLKSFLLMVVLAAGVALLALTHNSYILYILALVSASSVVVVLTMLYSMVTVMVLRMENRFERFSELGFALVAGFGIGLLQIALIDLVRFAFTGTWDGFHFG
jgi:uncharacterized membrane protein